MTEKDAAVIGIVVAVGVGYHSWFMDPPKKKVGHSGGSSCVKNTEHHTF